MKTLQEFRNRLSSSFEQVNEGWSRLWRQAKQAMTRFSPAKSIKNDFEPFADSG